MSCGSHLIHLDRLSLQFAPQRKVYINLVLLTSTLLMPLALEEHFGPEKSARRVDIVIHAS